VESRDAIGLRDVLYCDDRSAGSTVGSGQLMDVVLVARDAGPEEAGGFISVLRRVELGLLPSQSCLTPDLTLTVVDCVLLGFVAGLDGPRCLRCCRISSKLARTGTVVVIN
jgi:hypothetical protein